MLIPNGTDMTLLRNFNQPLEKIVTQFTCNGIDYDVVERIDTLWVGCLNYAENNHNEPDSGATIEGFQKLINVGKKDLINDSWSAAI